jgi:hypothetical protein
MGLRRGVSTVERPLERNLILKSYTAIDYKLPSSQVAPGKRLRSIVWSNALTW